MERGGALSNLGGSPWSGGSSWSVEAHPRTLEAHPGLEAYHVAGRLTLEPWRLTLEWLLIMERGGSLSTLEAHPGVEAHHRGWRLTLEPWRLTLEWMLIMERGGLPSNLGGSPWSGCSSWRVEAHPRTLEARMLIMEGGGSPWRLGGPNCP
jgi:hypothetical protein